MLSSFGILLLLSLSSSHPRTRTTTTTRMISTTRRRAFSSLAGTNVGELLARLGLSHTATNRAVYHGGDASFSEGSGEEFAVINPSTNGRIATVRFGNLRDYERCVTAAMEAKLAWENTPAPVRGEVIRQLANNLRAKKKDLGALISLEMGKILAEGEGEVQEFIDICDMATGMARQIGNMNGVLFPSERRNHTMIETWNPLKGLVGIIPAFNFPHAVFGWNAVISLVCGNAQIVKGAETASLVTVATQKVLVDTLRANGVDARIAALCQGRGSIIGEAMSGDPRVELLSFTGSIKTGRHVATRVAARLGKTILELGGNNAVLVMEDADLDMALSSVLFASVGTCGQRCTSLRRLLVHESIFDKFTSRLAKAYASIQIGDPLDRSTLCGPLHTKEAVRLYHSTLEVAQKQGGKLLALGGDAARVERLVRETKGNYVRPALIEISPSAPITKEERFIPVVYAMRVGSFEEAVAINNSVPQGLTSSVFTKDMRKVFKWISPTGSDCGIANVNTSCSGAEIGGSFGGNKETGWGRESGSDAWKAYMRRGTSTINFGSDVALAQGIDFSSGVS